MPYIYLPDNTPSRNYGRNTQSSTFGGSFSNAGSDPRKRGRQRSRAEIEASSRAEHVARLDHQDAMRERVNKKKEAEQLALELKSSASRSAKANEALANNPAAARREMMRQQTAAETKAKGDALAARGGKAERLTPEQSLAKGQAEKRQRDDVERAATERSNADARSRTATMDKLMSERMKPEGPSLGETLAASETAGRKALASNAYNTVFGQAAETPAPTAPAAAPKEPARRSVVAGKSAPTSAATQSAGAAFAEASKANPSMTPSEFFASRPDLIASMQADQGITGAPSMPGPARKPSVKFDAFGNAKPQKLPTPPEAHAYYAATNPQVPGAIPDPFGQTMSYVNTGIDRGLEVGQNIGNAAYETFFAPDKRAEITRAPARDPEVEALRQGSNLAKPMGQGGIAFDPTIRPDYKPEGPNWSPDMASGGSIDKPYDPKKVKTLADWLSGLIPDSFNDPNSMYYFPGKYN
jgi:hypothetical protein